MSVKILMSDGVVDLATKYYAKALESAGAPRWRIYNQQFYHQAKDKLGSGLKATAWSENGQVVEAIEHESLPIFAVQWHPERMVNTAEKYIADAVNAGAVDEESLFKKFIQICKQVKGE